MSIISQVRALCCECGNVRTISSRHHVRNDENRTTEVDHFHPERYWRCTGTLKCSQCKTMTRHALLRDDHPEYRDYAEERDHQRTPRRKDSLDDYRDEVERRIRGILDDLSPTDLTLDELCSLLEVLQPPYERKCG